MTTISSTEMVRSIFRSFDMSMHGSNLLDANPKIVNRVIKCEEPDL